MLAVMSDDPGQTPHSTTHFGFREVPETDKSELVRRVFESVAGRYDLMNDLMSAGVHRLWKSTLLDMIDPSPDQTLLDVAGGTGDIALGFMERIGAAAGRGHVVICDVNPAMVAIGRDRALDGGLTEGAIFVVGDAERLPFADSSVDVYTIGFGLRNVTHPAAAQSHDQSR